MTLPKKKKYTYIVSKWIITGNIGDWEKSVITDLYENLDEDDANKENELITHENLIAKVYNRSCNKNNDAEKKEAGRVRRKQ